MSGKICSHTVIIADLAVEVTAAVGQGATAERGQGREVITGSQGQVQLGPGVDPGRNITSPGAMIDVTLMLKMLNLHISGMPYLLLNLISGMSAK